MTSSNEMPEKDNVPNMLIPFVEFFKISQIGGTAKGLADAVERGNEYSKEGLISGLRRIDELAQDLQKLATMQRENEAALKRVDECSSTILHILDLLDKRRYEDIEHYGLMFLDKHGYIEATTKEFKEEENGRR